LCQKKILSRRREEYEENWFNIFLREEKAKKKTHFHDREIISFSGQG